MPHYTVKIETIEQFGTPAQRVTRSLQAASSRHAAEQVMADWRPAHPDGEGISITTSTSPRRCQSEPSEHGHWFDFMDGGRSTRTMPGVGARAHVTPGEN